MLDDTAANMLQTFSDRLHHCSSGIKHDDHAKIQHKLCSWGIQIACSKLKPWQTEKWNALCALISPCSLYLIVTYQFHLSPCEENWPLYPSILSSFPLATLKPWQTEKWHAHLATNLSVLALLDCNILISPFTLRRKLTFIPFNPFISAPFQFALIENLCPFASSTLHVSARELTRFYELTDEPTIEFLSSSGILD